MGRVKTAFPSVVTKWQHYVLQFQQSGINSHQHVVGSHDGEASGKLFLLEIKVRDSLDFTWKQTE